MISSTSSSILQKIQKLLRVRTDRGATEPEAEAAMTAVQRLLREHRLTMADVPPSATTDNETSNQQTVSQASYRFKKKSFYVWERRLMNVVGELCEVDYFINQSYEGGHQNLYPSFLGVAQDAYVAVEMYAYLHHTVTKLREQYLRENRSYIHSLLRSEPGMNMSLVHNSYMMGLVGRLRERVEELKEKERQENQASLKAVVLASRQLTRKCLEEICQGHTTRSSCRTDFDHANSHGYRDGEGVSLERKRILKEEGGKK